MEKEELSHNSNSSCDDLNSTTCESSHSSPLPFLSKSNKCDKVYHSKRQYKKFKTVNHSTSNDYLNDILAGVLGKKKSSKRRHSNSKSSKLVVDIHNKSRKSGLSSVNYKNTTVCEIVDNSLERNEVITPPPAHVKIIKQLKEEPDDAEEEESSTTGMFSSTLTESTRKSLSKASEDGFTGPLQNNYLQHILTENVRKCNRRDRSNSVRHTSGSINDYLLSCLPK